MYDMHRIRRSMGKNLEGYNINLPQARGGLNFSHFYGVFGAVGG